MAALAAKVAFLDECHEGDVLVRDGSGWRCAAEPQCPPGYRAVVDTEVAGCTRTVEGRDDVMVKVGDFWIDRYEMSACAAGGLGGEPANDTTAKACSSRGVMPLSSITWFQAAAMCANAGKHLCSNAEWQAAVSGTTDPGPWPFVDCATGGPQVGRCNTCSTDVRLTGQASAECRSRFGAEDMIGNEWEQVGDWFAAPGTDELSAVGAEPLGPGYSNDITSNVSGTAWEGESRQYGKRVPARGLRGGGRNDGTGAGAFALNLGGSPSDYGAAVGARCCRGGR